MPLKPNRSAFPSDALEPNIDKQTMEIHHGKHYAAYVNNYNKAVSEKQPELDGKPLHEVLANNLRDREGGDQDRRPQQRRRSAQSRAVLGNPQPRRQTGHAAGRQAGRCDQEHLRLIRCIQGKIRRRRHHALRLRLGVADQERRTRSK